MGYKIEFKYDDYGDIDHCDYISYKREFELNVLEIGDNIVLTDMEISTLENHRSIELNGTLYNINKLVLKIFSDSENEYLILVSDMNHLPF